jgi:hypothetical protein
LVVIKTLNGKTNVEGFVRHVAHLLPFIEIDLYDSINPIKSPNFPKAKKSP